MIELLAACALTRIVPARNPATVEFVVVGHLRGDDNGEELVYLDELVSDVRRLEPDHVFLTGDLIWGDVNSDVTDLAAVERDWERLDGRLAAIGAPLHRVPGNHDINDVGTRDLYLQRYGSLPRAVRDRECLFLLLSSAWIPADDDPRKHPQAFIRGKDLDPEQIEFVRSELARGGFEHAFVFMHHMLWWHESAPWWRDVHPVLAEDGRVRAVFAGDYGPTKFSHVARDGIDYVQSSVENQVSLEMLRTLESSRMLASQLDTFLHVTVRGPDVEIDVRPVAAFSSGKFTPAHHDAVFEYDKWSLGRRLQRKLGTPERLVRGLTLTALIGALAGAGATLLVTFLLWRRSR